VRLLAILVLLSSLNVGAEPLRIGGTGAGLGTMERLAREFSKIAPETAVTVVPNLGTSGGLKALAAGAIDLAVIARPLRPEETAQGLVAREYGKTPFVLATAAPGVTGFKDAGEVARAYSGAMANWPDGTPVRLVLRPRHDSDSELLRSFSPAVDQAVELALKRPGMIVASTDQEAADRLQSTPGALGTAALSLLVTEKRPLRALPIGGVLPNPDNIASGRYPLYKTMYLARKTAGSQPAQRFTDFVTSAGARPILIDSGHWIDDAPARK
jgi:phosphate transport system substrate-binding protein